MGDGKATGEQCSVLSTPTQWTTGTAANDCTASMRAGGNCHECYTTRLRTCNGPLAAGLPAMMMDCATDAHTWLAPVFPYIPHSLADSLTHTLDHPIIYLHAQRLAHLHPRSSTHPSNDPRWIVQPPSPSFLPHSLRRACWWPSWRLAGCPASSGGRPHRRERSQNEPLTGMRRGWSRE